MYCAVVLVCCCCYKKQTSCETCHPEPIPHTDLHMYNRTLAYTVGAFLKASVHTSLSSAAMLLHWGLRWPLPCREVGVAHQYFAGAAHGGILPTSHLRCSSSLGLPLPRCNSLTTELTFPDVLLRFPCLGISGLICLGYT